MSIGNIIFLAVIFIICTCGIWCATRCFYYRGKKEKKKKEKQPMEHAFRESYFCQSRTETHVNKIPFFVCVCGAPWGMLRQSEVVLLQVFYSLFFISLFSRRLPSLKLSWVKSSHVTLRRSVWFSQVLFKLQKHLKWIRKMFGFFLFCFSSINWTLPLLLFAFHLMRQLSGSDFNPEIHPSCRPPTASFFFF